MLIEALSLSKSFGARKAVENVSFAVRSPTTVGLLGANGAGKSTTMRMLAGVLLPDDGSARIKDHDLARARLQAQECLGYLPEAANGFSVLTALEFLTFVADAKGLKGSNCREGVDRIVQLLKLEAVIDRELGSLSKGWRQRVWLAQALLNDPPVLILDEPTDGLDPRQKVELRALLRELTKERAILMSTHILEEAEELCDHIIVMHDGCVVANATKSDLVDSKGRLAPAILDLTCSGPHSQASSA